MNENPVPLLSQHAALILTMAVVIGVSIGALTYSSERSFAKAPLAGLLAAGASVAVMHSLIG
ncbi:hypothetical protein P8A18_33150 (plasmid) [Streptomyces castrisilvae]|uniref:MHYT domain-containing protein n=1 Tax=Streptomyces castrisilvae TaxID=3033811 RepID=A0ABY9HUY1_9ACTN|nr:hypothetical protein [Streptomyces sp. Mut1]WLQ38377.1 hypothetical protein P8A18_33150 [Streptomyces sp. Mut1]